MPRALIACKLIWDSMDEFADLLESAGVEWDIPEIPGQQLAEADLVRILGPYHGILAGDDELTRTALEAAPNLRVISKWGIGVDAIDHEAARERGIRIYNTPGVFEAEIAEYAMGMILLLSRRQHQIDAGVRAGEWTKVRGTTLAGKTLGVVGFGSSGRGIAQRAAAFGMKVLAHDIVEPATVPDGVRMAGLDDVVAGADVISLHTNLTPENRHLFDADRLARMKPGAWIVNTSRGPLIDEQALVSALESGQVGAAALDVFESEPFDASSPLASFPNVVLGSHNASNTHEAVARTNIRAIENLLDGLEAGE